MGDSDKIRRDLAQAMFDQGMEALSSPSDDVWMRAMEGPLGRDIRLHHEIDLGYQDPGDVETRTAPIILLREFLESVGALESNGGEWWVEPVETRLPEAENLSGSP